MKLSTRLASPLAALAVAAAAATLATGGATPDATAAPAPVAAVSAAAQQAHPTTHLTFPVAHCEGCQIQLVQALPNHETIWQSHSKKVHDGSVSFTLATKHTHGMSATVISPWELRSKHGIGARTEVIFAYDDVATGTRVPFAQARHEKPALACWAGSSAGQVTIPLSIKKIRVPGNGGPADATIAWATRTRPAWLPVEKTYHGILATQDVAVCSPPQS